MIKERLKNKWNINVNDFWIPLHGELIENTCYFNTNAFLQSVNYENVYEFLKSIEPNTIYFYNEVKESGELNIENYNDSIDLDSFYTDINSEWIVYKTHENTIAFAGKDIIEQIKKIIPNWKELINPWE